MFIHELFLSINKDHDAVKTVTHFSQGYMNIYHGAVSETRPINFHLKLWNGGDLFNAVHAFGKRNNTG